MQVRVGTTASRFDTQSMTDVGDSSNDGPPRRPARVSFRVAAIWGLGVVATLGAAIVSGAAGIILTAFGLGGVVLLASALLITVGATVWRRALLPLAVVAVATALPAAWAAQTEVGLDRSHGTLIVKPRIPSDVAAETYRRGVGPVLVDLRDFVAPDGSTTHIAARADAGKLVVALPTDRCFNLDIRYHLEPLSGPSQLALATARAFTGAAGGDAFSTSGVGLTLQASQSDSLRAEQGFLRGNGAASPYELLAFNRWPSEAGRYRRAAMGKPRAPTLQLDLGSSQQMVVRDYPDDVGPLSLNFSAPVRGQVSGMLWPDGMIAPLAPVERSWKHRSKVRSPENRARWIAWERRMIAWAKAQAKRAAGPCASREDLRARGVTFLTQPEVVVEGTRVDRLLGSARNRRSVIPQRSVHADDDMLVVEVDGLGTTSIRGVRPVAGNGDAFITTPGMR